MMVVNGWIIYAHPLLLRQMEKLTRAVEKERAKSPATYAAKANAKTLAAVRRAIFLTVPEDPTRPEYRQGGTLGSSRKHWFRFKFGNGRFRLFFRFDSKAKILIFAWVNDADSLRTYGSKTDAYAVFKTRLKNGNPPDSWDALLTAAASDEALRNLENARDANR